MFIIAGSMISRRPGPSSSVERALERVGVVERDGAGQLGDRLRDAGAVGDRSAGRRGRRAPRRRVDRDHHRVVVAVVGALDLEDRCRGR